MSIGEQLMNLGFPVAHYSDNVYKTWFLSTVTLCLFIPLPRGVFSPVNRNDDGLHYPPRDAKKLAKYEPKPFYPTSLNILNGPYKRHLNTTLVNDTLPLEERTEDPRNYINKVHEKYPHLKKFILESSLNEELFELENKKLKRTIYQTDYYKHLG
ncbi:hypothetical protein HZH66_011207 [Vespula vulgaris]|uniref:Uncharacterized protein n=1 Tax=Vespula vulgaris TaxID=7454 RepID=A0A834JEX1_VESVU|nr:hypothetical protein HZH66_011207 [Vespula vulgaris]